MIMCCQPLADSIFDIIGDCSKVLQKRNRPLGQLFLPYRKAPRLKNIN